VGGGGVWCGAEWYDIIVVVVFGGGGMEVVLVTVVVVVLVVVVVVVEVCITVDQLHSCAPHFQRY